MAVKTVIEAIREGMDEEMARDPSVFLIGEDVGNRGGVFLASDGLYKKYGELRVIDSPLAESCIVGVAIGAAVNGMRPIAEIQFADFIAPAMNQIIEEAARFCYRTAGDFNLPMVIRAPWGGGVHGALYHSQSIEATFSHIPGLKVVAPGTPADAKGLLKAAVRDPDLRRPESDAGPPPGRHPDAVLGSPGDGEPEHADVEPLRGAEVEHLKHKLVYAGDWDAAHAEDDNHHDAARDGAAPLAHAARRRPRRLRRALCRPGGRPLHRRCHEEPRTE